MAVGVKLESRHPRLPAFAPAADQPGLPKRFQVAQTLKRTRRDRTHSLSKRRKKPVRMFACGLLKRTGTGCRAQSPGQVLHGTLLLLVACWRRGPRAQRNPLFLFLFSGLFLFRFAERRFSAGLLKAPPRSIATKSVHSKNLTPLVYLI